MSKTAQQVSANIEGDFIDYMSGNKIKLAKNQKINLKPWQYYILIRE
jgi:alpha-amylase